jgi:hypothetical protein
VANGQAAVAPPISMTNSRRLIPAITQYLVGAGECLRVLLFCSSRIALDRFGINNEPMAVPGFWLSIGTAISARQKTGTRALASLGNLYVVFSAGSRLDGTVCVADD